MATMKTLSNGVKIPWIGFGTGSALSKRDAYAPVSLALQTGFRHFDCAQGYNNEDTLGKAIAKFPRESLFVTTKLRTLDDGQTVRESLQGSLERLGLKYVDLWLIHNPNHHHGKLKEVWKACEEVYNEGLVKAIGVSNFNVKQLREILDGATVIPQINQIEFHPYLLKTLKPLVDLHQEYRIVTESYGGLAPITSNPNGPLDPVLKAVKEAVEKRHGAGVTEAQVLLKWLHFKDVVIVTTSSKESRMKEYLDAANVPALTPEEVKTIDEAGSKAHFRKFGYPHMDN